MIESSHWITEDDPQQRDDYINKLPIRMTGLNQEETSSLALVQRNHTGTFSAFKLIKLPPINGA